jgi:hypothetical protein
VQSLHDCTSRASADFISRYGKEWEKVMNVDDIRFEVFEGQRISAARSRQYSESLISRAGIDGAIR